MATEFFPFPSLPLSNLTGLNSPQDTERITCLDRYPPSSSRVVRTNVTYHLHLRTRNLLVVESPAIRACAPVVSIRSQRPYFLHKDNVSPLCSSHRLHWFCARVARPVSDDAVTSGRWSSRRSPQRQAGECRLPRPSLAVGVVKHTHLSPTKPNGSESDGTKHDICCLNLGPFLSLRQLIHNPLGDGTNPATRDTTITCINSRTTR